MSQKVAGYLQQCPTEKGYAVNIFVNGTDGSHAAIVANHNLVILSVLPPGKYGSAVVSSLCSSSQVFVLMLTACNDTYAEVQGFSLDPDVYLVTPSQSSAFLARARARLKYPQIAGSSAGLLRAGNL